MIYIIVLIHGMIGGVNGPLSLTMKECIEKVSDMNEEISINTKTNHLLNGVYFKCVESKEKPIIGRGEI